MGIGFAPESMEIVGGPGRETAGTLSILENNWVYMAGICWNVSVFQFGL